MTRFAGRVALGVLLTLSGAGLPVASSAEPPAVEVPVARHSPDVSDDEIRSAVADGVAYLLRTQHADGSWGSPAPTLYLDIMAPGEPSLRAYQVASCGLALSALIEVGGDHEGVADAIVRGRDWLLANHEVRRDTPRVIYNIWAHAYALEAFARLLARETDASMRARLKHAAERAVHWLTAYEYVDGGWGYYSFSMGTRTPGPGHSNSFTTSTVLVALRMAADQGVAIPARIVDRGRALVRASRLPGGAYAYSFNFGFRMPSGVNKPEGSLARTPACLAGLLAWGEGIPTSRVVGALDRLEEKGYFLRIARKYPFPHESWFQNSGYFCFYGYYYASSLLDDVPAAKRAFHRRRIAAHMVKLQESDGAWWDYQLYGYHKPYGTGYVLLTLGRCLAAAEGETPPDS